jgi:hypothetical protein
MAENALPISQGIEPGPMTMLQRREYLSSQTSAVSRVLLLIDLWQEIAFEKKRQGGFLIRGKASLPDEQIMFGEGEPIAVRP